MTMQLYLPKHHKKATQAVLKVSSAKLIIFSDIKKDTVAKTVKNEPHRIIR